MTSIVVQPTGRSNAVRPRRRWCSIASSPSWAALIRRAASLDTTTVRPWTACPSDAARMRLSFFVGVEAVLPDLVQVQAVRLDAQRAAVGERHRTADVAVVRDPQLLDRPDHRPCRPAHVVHAALVLVELLHHDQRDHRIGAGERRDESGSEMSTDVSSTIRVAVEGSDAPERAWSARRSVKEPPRDREEGGWAGDRRSGTSSGHPAIAGGAQPRRCGEPAGSPPLSEPHPPRAVGDGG